MKYLIDIIILLFIAIVTFINYRKGLIKVAFGLFSFIIAIVISVLLYKPLSNFIINKTSLDETVYSVVYDKLSNQDLSTEEKNNLISNYFTNAKNASVSVLSEGISKSIINIACVLIVFIASKLVLFVFRFIGDLFAKLPIIKQINSIGGFCFGILKSFILIYAFFAITSILSPFLDINNFINIINNSILANIIYNNNIILVLFS